MRLSVLDQSPISEGSTGAEALANTLDLARLADELGYHRYWVAEHHGGPMLAGPAPEVLIAPIAAATARIRVGSGGVMLPHYSPFKVAETFTLLGGLYPGRIDLGLGRAAGTDPLTTLRAAARPPQGDARRLPPAARRAARLPRGHAARPTTRSRVADDTARAARAAPGAVAARLVAAERDLGRPSSGCPTRSRTSSTPTARRSPRLPQRARRARRRTAVAVWAICAETDEEAQRLASSSRMAISAAAPRAADRGAAAREGAALPRGLRVVVGPRAPRRSSARPSRCAPGIEEVAQAYGAEEVIVVTITYDHGARRRSYELIAEAFGLGRDGGAAERAAGDRVAAPAQVAGPDDPQ